MGAPTAWGAGITGNGIGVAVIDSGIDFNQADLQPLSPICFALPSSGSCQDDHGHGTHVAGIIAARNNTRDVVGVAPNATLYAVKVLGTSGAGTWSDTIAGVDWVTARAGTIKVANMSLGGAPLISNNTTNCGDPDNNGIIDDPLHKAICNSVAAGITYVVAAGNNQLMQINQAVPAAYPEVMAVASTTAVNGIGSCRSIGSGVLADTASYFTTDGAGVAISAPGEEREDVSTRCVATPVGILSTRLNGGTIRMSGTSMASPHVAGIAALALQANPALTPATLRTLITSTAMRIGVAPLNSSVSGYSYDGVREGIASAAGVVGP